MTRSKNHKGTMAMAATLTVSYLAVSSLTVSGVKAQNPFNDNQTWANQPPGTFLNNKAATKKPAVAVKKPVAKLAPLKPNVQQGSPQFSTQQPEQFQQRQQAVGQSEWQQMGTSGAQQQGQQGSSDWVEPSGDLDQPTQDTQQGGQGWVTNTQAPANYGQGNSNSGGQIGSSGWNTPGGTSGNSSTGGTGGGNQNSNIGTSGWVTPGGGSQPQSTQSNNNAGAFSSQGVGNYQPPQPNNIQTQSQSQWNTPVTNNNNNSGNNFNTASSPPAFPPSSFRPAGQGQQPANGQAPLLGDVLEQEQLQGGVQSSGNMGNMGNGASTNMVTPGSGAGQAMPAFSQGSAAGFMPAIMNMMQTIMPQKGAVFNPNLGSTGSSTGSGTLNNTGSNIFVPQQQVRRPAVHHPMRAPRLVTQTGKQVSRQLNRNVNRMLYRGMSNLRF